ncbi:MAG: DMT family transporter [Saprospiraceae bacterium]
MQVSGQAPAPLSDLKSWIFLLLIGVTWGSSYFFIKHGLLAFNPVQLFSLRISIASLAFVPMAIAAFRKVKKAEYKYLLIVGFCGSFFPAFLFAVAQTKLSSSLTGVLSSLSPIWTLVVGGALYGLILTKNHIIGVGIGLIGALSLVFTGEQSFSGSILYAGCVILATFLYAFSTNSVNSKLSHLSAMEISGVAFSFIGLPALVILFQSGFIEVMQSHLHAWPSFWNICALALLGTFMASLVYFKLIKISGAVFASTVSYIIPVVAIILGSFDGESLSFSQIFGMLCVLLGVYISKQSPKQVVE